MSDQYSFEDREELILLRKALSTATSRLREGSAETSYERFLRPLEARSIDGNHVTLESPSEFVTSWVTNKFLDDLRKLIGSELGHAITLEIITEPKAKQHSKPMTVSVAQPVTDLDADFCPPPQFTFENFVVGQSNRLAVAGAKGVAANPGSRYNPLFIYGSSGLGKTHLLYAIANQVKRNDPKAKVRYMTSQIFVERFIKALQNNQTNEFREELRASTVWLLDDVQFIADKQKSQEELFHTFNALYQLGKQIVLCADRSPRDLLLMDNRLRSRLEAGLLADVQMPDTETRCAIILTKAEEHHVPLQPEIAMFLAQAVPGNIRILEGALTKLATQASLDDGEITLELAKEVVDGYYSAIHVVKPSMSQIIQAVSEHCQISVDEIVGQSRKSPVARARQIAVYLAREITNDSWKHIGSHFGNRDHTTVMYSHQTVRDKLKMDRDLSNSIRQLMADLYPVDS